MTPTEELNVHRMIGWLPDGRRLVAEDWPTRDLTVTAYGIARAALEGFPSIDPDVLADIIVARLRVDRTRPFGCSILVGPD